MEMVRTELFFLVHRCPQQEKWLFLEVTSEPSYCSVQLRKQFYPTEVHMNINFFSLIRKIFHSSGLQRNFISMGFKTKSRGETLVQLCEDFILLPIEEMKQDL